MINIKIDEKNIKASDNALELFQDDFVKRFRIMSVIELMNNCLDVIYHLAVSEHPKVFKPKLFITESDEINAFAYKDKYIVIHSGLVFEAAKLLETRYKEELLNKYGILRDYPHSKIMSCLRVYLWRYIVLHELYHIWGGHQAWKSKYKTSESGEIVEREEPGESSFIINETITSFLKKNNTNSSALQNLLTSQALEFDADSCAVSMMINLLRYDADSRKVPDKKMYIKNHMALIMGALSTAFCLFDGNAGARFEVLKQNLSNSTHPLPSIRFYYAEEIADAMLQCYFEDEDELREIESEWTKIVCEVEPEFKGEIDMGQVFYYTALTEKAQRHICDIKRRLYLIQKTKRQFVIGNLPAELDEESMEFCPESVWFTDDGRSLAGWINPATSDTSAVNPSHRTFIKKNKVGVNDLCPCGSGRKFKKCCRGKGIYDD